jgi:vacuolar-type H+-ATPase subunit H
MATYTTTSGWVDLYTAAQVQEAVRAALASKPDARMHAREAAESMKRKVRQYAIDYADYRAEAGFDRRDEIMAKLAEVEAAIDALSAHGGVKQPEPADDRKERT